MPPKVIQDGPNFGTKREDHLYYRPRGVPNWILAALTDLITTEPFPAPQGLPSYFRRPADVRHI